MSDGRKEQLLSAAASGDAEPVRRLLDGAPSLVNGTDVHGKTPLHLAAEHDHAAVAEVLLASGADVEAETSWGMTPIQWAATVGSGSVGALLVGADARLNLYSAAGLGLIDQVRSFWRDDGSLRDGAAQPRYAEEGDGRWVKLPPPEDDATVVSQALQVAARNGHVEVVELLLARGGDIDHPGYFGAPGLHWAAINGHSQMVAFLLERGADTAVLDERFAADALGWAREGGDEETIELLERAARER